MTKEGIELMQLKYLSRMASYNNYRTFWSSGFRVYTRGWPASSS